MAPIISSSQCTMPFRFTPQILVNRDLWLHALTLPTALVQRLFMTETLSTSRTPYHLPAERCAHLRTLMAWPDDSFNDNAEELLLARQEVASIANVVAKYEPVWMYASHQNIPIAESHVSKNVTMIEVDVDHLWLRDTGPVLVTTENRGALAGIDFRFNYWGGNFIIPTGTDETLSQRLLKHNDIRQISASIVTEGGALEVDGEGTLLTTESSLLNPNRNGDKDKAGMEDTFRELLGVTKTIWLEGVKGRDVSDYHIDRLARFGHNSSIVVLSRPHNSIPWWDPRYIAYEQARFVLGTSTNAKGHAFEIVEIEEAATVPRAEEHGWAPGVAATSYVNFYLANGVVIIPQFGEYRTDEMAVQIMEELFPDRVVETVTLNWMPWAGGGPHCATQQWPLAEGMKNDEAC